MQELGTLVIMVGVIDLNYGKMLTVTKQRSITRAAAKVLAEEHRKKTNGEGNYQYSWQADADFL